MTNKLNTVSKKKYLQENIHPKSVQQPNFNISSEDYDPLAVTFIEPKTQMSRTVPVLSANLEPKSLDLAPVNESFETFDDEFSDFQSAQFSFTNCKNNHEFTNFQSAFDTLSLKETTKSVENHVEFLSVSSVDAISIDCEPNLISYQDDDIHDKYKAFRNLAVETVDTKDLANEDLIVRNNLDDLLYINAAKNIEEQVKNYDVSDEEFGEFLCVEEIMNNKAETEVDWKHVQVYLAIVQYVIYLIIFGSNM